MLPYPFDLKLSLRMVQGTGDRARSVCTRTGYHGKCTCRLAAPEAELWVKVLARLSLIVELQV